MGGYRCRHYLLCNSVNAAMDGRYAGTYCAFCTHLVGFGAFDATVANLSVDTSILGCYMGHRFSNQYMARRPTLFRGDLFTGQSLLLPCDHVDSTHGFVEAPRMGFVHAPAPACRGHALRMAREPLQWLTRLQSSTGSGCAGHFPLSFARYVGACGRRPAGYPLFNCNILLWGKAL